MGGFKNISFIFFIGFDGICSWGSFRVFHFQKLPDYRACVTSDVLCGGAYCTYGSMGICAMRLGLYFLGINLINVSYSGVVQETNSRPFFENMISKIYGFIYFIFFNSLHQ